MNIIQHIIHIFTLSCPIIWTWLLGNKANLIDNIILALGSFFSALILYLYAIYNDRKMKKPLLQHIKTKVDGDIVILSHQEILQLGYLRKHFIKQEGHLNDACNNPEGNSKYKISEKMKQKMSKV